MPKLIFVVTEDWFFASHFLPMARAAQAMGCAVAVATRVRAHGEAIARAGVRVIPLEADRGSLHPGRFAQAFTSLLAILRAEKPDIVHCIALKSIMLGGLAARLAGTKTVILAPTGLGRLWIERDAVHAAVRAAVRAAMRAFLRGPRFRYLFENAEDPAEFGLDPGGPDVTVVGGAGVDPGAFPAAPEPASPPVRIAVIARMIVPKGIAEAVAATRMARAAGVPVEISLFGEPDPANRSSIPEAALRAWSAEPGIAWHGRTEDVAQVWREHHVALLLSYREGLPRTLVEAAACGRPIIAADVPGCRELVRDGVEGLLVPPRDPAAAARAIERLAADPALRARLGRNARARFEERFTEAAVMRAVGALYATAGAVSPARG